VTTKDSKSGFYFLYALICLIWGSTWLVIHVGANAGLPPFTGAALRFFVATALLWLYAIYKKTPLPANAKEWAAVLLVGSLSNGISFGVVYWSSAYIPSGLGAVIFGTMPLWTAMISHWAFKSQKLSPVRIFGIVLGIIGIATIFYPQFSLVDSKHLWVMMIFLISPVVSAISAIITKRSTQAVAPLMLNSITTGVGCLILGSIAILREPVGNLYINFTQIWTIGYLAVIGTIVTFGIYFRLMKETSAVTMSYVAIITPVIAVVLGWLMLNETFDYYALAGSGLVICGVGMSLRM